MSNIFNFSSPLACVRLIYFPDQTNILTLVAGALNVAMVTASSTNQISVSVVLLRIVGSVVFQQKIANNKVDFIQTCGFIGAETFVSQPRSS